MEHTSTETALSDVLLLTPAVIEAYLQTRRDQGVAASALTKDRQTLGRLTSWLGDDRHLDASRLQAWRASMDASGYSKSTIQRHISRVNNFLRSCGGKDLHIPKPARNDLTGRTFGYLTALEPVERRQHGYVVWRCICKCGREVELPSSMLLRGCTTSCGCLNLEILRHRNRYQEGTELRQALEEKIRNPHSASGYVGVQPKRNKWTAHITYKKKHYYLGTFDNIEDAIKARARAKEAVMEDAERIYEATDHLYGASPRRPARPERTPIVPETPVVVPARRSDNTSGCPGVVRSKGKWAANITVHKFRYRLGAYDRREDAVAARKRAEALVMEGDMDALQTMCTNWTGQDPPTRENEIRRKRNRSGLTEKERNYE